MELNSDLECELLKEFRNLQDSDKCPNLEETTHLIRFLRTKNYDVQRAVEVHSKYHEMLRKNAEVFSKMTPSRVRYILEKGIVTKLPGTDLEGRAIFFFRFGNWDTKEIPIDDLYPACVLLLEEMSYYPEIQKHGMIMLHDYNGFGLSHVAQLSLKNFLRILQLAQGTFPIKMKGFHEVNQPTLFWILYKIFYPLLSNKLKKRVFLHGNDTTSLLSHFHPSVLPKSLGGTAEILSDQIFMEKLYERDDYYSSFLAQLSSSL